MVKLGLSAAAGLLCFVLILVVVPILPTTYTGQEAFRTEEGYTIFKEEVVSSEALINSITVLTSQPPIIVKFSVSIPSGGTFAYGDPRRSSNVDYIVFLIVSILVGVFVYVVIDAGVSIKREASAGGPG